MDDQSEQAPQVPASPNNSSEKSNAIPPEYTLMMLIWHKIKIPLLILLVIAIPFAIFFGYSVYHGFHGLSSSGGPKLVTKTPTPATASTAEWKTYTSNDSAYTFNYPANLYIKSSPKYGTTVFISTNDVDIDKAIEGPGTDITLFQEKGAEIPADFYKIKESIHNPLQENITIDGVKGVKISGVLSGYRDGTFNISIALPKDGTVTNFDFYENTKDGITRQEFDQILSTFKFTDQTAVQSYLNVPDWKVRLPAENEFAKLKLGDVKTGTAYSSTDQTIEVIAPELDAGWTCVSDKNGVKGTIGEIVRTSNTTRSGPYQPLATKKLGNYTYTYEATTTSNCTKDPKYAELVKSFANAFSSLATN